MPRKYQIFISSTYKDLIKERQQVVQIILRVGHIPAGMELFGQDDGEQWKVIKKWINESDIFIIMVKNRYGTICKGEHLSYTHMEYEYAKELNKPIIKVVFNEDIDAAECDNIEKLRAFRKEIMEDGVAGPILNSVEMTQRITDKIRDYTKQLNGGWCRYDEMKASYAETRYKLMQFLMFDEEGEGQRGHNRFNVLPKILMLQDMKGDYNEVEIGELEIEYTIGMNDESYKTNLYDCKRKWTIHNMRNVSNHVLNNYRFFTATDIGNRNNENGSIKIRRVDNGKKLVLSEESYKNNGISCWKWIFETGIGQNMMLHEMILDEAVDCGWNLNKRHEIIYFIPKCFGQKIDNLNIIIKADEKVPCLQMEMFEIEVNNTEIIRNSKGLLECVKNSSGERIYGKTLANGVNMENVYYIVIEKIV